ncbi:MAG TPA: DUF2497 domain-containing protein [Stellaceae bacterium]|nr:DUF2497 domain-containing protein [Stellaceae bacterium]
MDEILTAIRRIVAADERPGALPLAAPLRAADPADEDEVLELTDAVAEDGTIRQLPPHGARAATNAPPVVSAAVSSAAASAFSRLAAALDQPDPAREPPVIGGRTLDDIVGDQLRPLLQAWLDANLPRLVERLVAAEIARIAGRSGSNGG